MPTGTLEMAGNPLCGIKTRTRKLEGASDRTGVEPSPLPLRPVLFAQKPVQDLRESKLEERRC